MKIALFLGKGVEGCGVTKNAIEFSRYYKNCEVFATIDKTWHRPNDLVYTPVMMGDDSALDALVYKLDTFDAVVFYSMPNRKHPKECQDNFIKMVEMLQTKKIAVHHDHSYKTLHDNANIDRYFRSVDLVIAHSKKGALFNWMQKSGITTPFIEMCVTGFAFDETRAKYWRPLDEIDRKTVRWIGRTAQWKGPTDMIDFHNDELRSRGYRTILEGLEASIQYAIVLYHDGHGKTQPRDLQDFFRKFKGNVDAGKEGYGLAPFCYPPYVNAEMLERLSRSGFASNLYHLKPELYGQNVEYCHAECASVGSIPLFHRHFGQHVLDRVTGKPLVETENNGTVWLSADTQKETAELMDKINGDPGMRMDWREMSFEFWKRQINNKAVVDGLIKTYSEAKKQAHAPPQKASSLEAFFS